MECVMSIKVLTVIEVQCMCVIMCVNVVLTA